MAWKAADSGVQLNTVIDPADGRFMGSPSNHVHSAAVMYHYEVRGAQHQLAHVGADEFEMEFPAGATISNVGFHAPRLPLR